VNPKNTELYSGRDDVNVPAVAARCEEVPGGCGHAAPRTPSGLGDDPQAAHIWVARNSVQVHLSGRRPGERASWALNGGDEQMLGAK
jgi:hypothetical protein